MFCSQRRGSPTAARLCAYALAVSAFLLPVTLSAQAPEMRIVPLLRDGMVLVTVQQPDSLDEQLRAAIQSGLKTTFAYAVDLRMEVPAWVDRTVASSVVSQSVEYDSLTRRYTIIRVVDGRTEEAVVTGDLDLVQKMVTGLDKLPLFSTRLLEAQREYYVRVRAEARPRGGSYLWPWGGGRSGQAKFTFIP